MTGVALRAGRRNWKRRKRYELTNQYNERTNDDPNAQA